MLCVRKASCLDDEMDDFSHTPSGQNHIRLDKSLTCVQTLEASKKAVSSIISAVFYSCGLQTEQKRLETVAPQWWAPDLVIIVIGPHPFETVSHELGHRDNNSPHWLKNMTPIIAGSII